MSPEAEFELRSIGGRVVLLAGRAPGAEGRESNREGDGASLRPRHGRVHRGAARASRAVMPPTYCLRIVRVAIFFVLALVAIPATAQPASHRPSGCSAHALHVKLKLQGATGSLLGVVELLNTGRRACTIAGPLTLRLFDKAGHHLPLRHSGDSAATVVVLRPGWSAEALIQFFNACANYRSARLFLVANHGALAIPLGPPGGRCDEPNWPPGYSLGSLLGPFRP